MSYAEFLDTLRTVAVCLGAFAAIVGVWKYRSDAAAARKLRWQKTTVQAILQAPGKPVSFEDLKTKYRSFAAEHMRQKLGADDISDEALRMILVDLCADNVLVQMGEDQYALTTYLGQMEAMKDVSAKVVALQETFFAAQLEFLAKQDESIREMLEHQKAVAGTLVPDYRHADLKEVK
ncbi:hypothetical protein [Tateyamaria sp. syn59]|uniref:hypothetical protein n=1 Tax=Tateyamaria sp. syn59 TaxID=2576942 RepID=UPI0011BDF560|nr:hypothetical protein [Tateyamaria sp. syn59]